METSGLHVNFTASNSSLKSVVRESTGLVDQYGRSLTKLAAAEDTTATAAQKTSAAYNRLRMQYDTAYASSVRYQKAAALIDKTAKQQAWSQDRLNNELRQAAMHYNIAEGAVDGMNRAVRTSRFHTANLAAQFNDIGVMMASGQSPFILAMQQGTQVSQVLNSMGGTARTQLAALGRSFMSVINPTSLLTIGVIAAGAALFQMGKKALSASEDLADLEENMEAVRDRTREATEAYEIFLRGLGSTTEYRLVMDIIAQQQEITRLTEAEAKAQGQMKRAAAERVAQAKARLVEMESALEALREAEIKEESIEEITKQIQLNQENFVRALTASIDEAERLRAKMAAVAAASPQMMNLEFMYGANAPRPTTDQDTIARWREDRNKPTPSGSSGGGSGRATTDPIIAELTRLQDALKTAEELQMASYQRQQEVLDEALLKRLITQEEYNRLMETAQGQHADRLAQIDAYRYGDTLTKTGQFLGDMATAFSSGNEKMLKVSKAFGAAQALISAWQGAAEALKLGFPQNLAAFAQVLATGMGAVSAIKSVTASGGGGGGASVAAAAPVAAANTSPRVALQLVGSENSSYSQSQIRDLINKINEATEGGSIVRLV